jgi:hypothetical protein
MLQQSLTNLQLEVLKLYSTDIREADRIWKERNFSDSDMENWLHK